MAKKQKQVVLNDLRILRTSINQAKKNRHNEGMQLIHIGKYRYSKAGKQTVENGILTDKGGNKFAGKVCINPICTEDEIYAFRNAVNLY